MLAFIPQGGVLPPMQFRKVSGITELVAVSGEWRGKKRSTYCPVWENYNVKEDDPSAYSRNNSSRQQSVLYEQKSEYLMMAGQRENELPSSIKIPCPSAI